MTQIGNELYTAPPKPEKQFIDAMDMHIPIYRIKLRQYYAWRKKIESPVACGFIVIPFHPSPLES